MTTTLTRHLDAARLDTLLDAARPEVRGRVSRVVGLTVETEGIDAAIGEVLLLGAERPVPADAIVFGELSLSGEVRPVAHDALRLREAAKLGFSNGWGPKGMKRVNGIGVTGFVRLGELVDLMLGRD